MSLSHPYRYTNAFRAQLDRLERLSPSISFGKTNVGLSRRFLEIEHTGATTAMIAQRNRRLHHMERLIADWGIDGGIKLAACPRDLTETLPSTVEITDAPTSVVYVEFGHDRRLDLKLQPQSRVEGFYIREIVSDGRFCAEITFVCNEPAWKKRWIAVHTRMQ